MDYQSILAKTLIDFFIFNPKSPFIFTTISFWFFFALVLLVDAFIYRKRATRHLFLFIASLFFYYKTTGLFFILLLLTAVWDFFIGKKIATTVNPLKKKMWLTCSVVLNLSILCYFKYAYFFTDSYNAITGSNNHVFNWLSHWSNGFFGSHFEVGKIILPIGISFFTFQSISYTIEVFRGTLQPVKRFTDFAFFVTFFPQLVAGPIVRATDFIPQIYKNYALSRHEFGLAIFWIMNGLTKKIILSDFIAVNLIDRVFENPDSYTGIENLLAIYGYSLQVYADFSGYTDIAIGVALLMGFHLTKNFDSPYKATNVSDFWRRWHISLSHWLRDYLYIPLGGNKTGSLATYILAGLILGIVILLSGSWKVLVIVILVVLGIVIACRLVRSFSVWITTNLNLMITMLLGGLWHGASWNFIIWGGLNGLGLIFYKLWKRISPWEVKNTWYKRAWTIFLTFTFITFTRVWFRAGSSNSWSGMNDVHDVTAEFLSATTMLHRIFFHTDIMVAPQVVMGYLKVLLVIVAGLVIHWLPASFKECYRNRFAALPLWAMVLVCFFGVVVLYQATTTAIPFIYFQF
ncbi:MAG: MBOAT family protein [Crocinitomicaceae bacterium]|nr:MBOAT family protein [Crocinitomicaceae bacterium]